MAENTTFKNGTIVIVNDDGNRFYAKILHKWECVDGHEGETLYRVWQTENKTKFVEGESGWFATYDVKDIEIAAPAAEPQPAYVGTMPEDDPSSIDYQPAAMVEPVTCVGCGEPLSHNDLWCEYCGAELSENITPADDAAAESMGETVKDDMPRITTYAQAVDVLTALLRYFPMDSLENKRRNEALRWLESAVSERDELRAQNDKLRASL